MDGTSQHDSSNSTDGQSVNINLSVNYHNAITTIINDHQEQKEQQKQQHNYLYIDRYHYQSIDGTIGLNQLLTNFYSVNIISTTANINNNNSNLNKKSISIINDTATCKYHNNLVILISSYIWDYNDSIKHLLNEKDWSSCTIYCSMSELAHLSHPHQPVLPTANSSSTSSSANQTSGGYKSIYERYQMEYYDILDGNINENVSCKINYLSLNYSLPLPNLFTIPIQQSLYPPLYFIEQFKSNSAGGNNSSSGGGNESLKRLPFEIQEDVHKTIYSILSFLEFNQIGSFSGDGISIYPVGQYSNYISGEMLSILSTINHQQKNDYHQVSLVLVDRYLDLVGPCSHSENSLDRIFNTIESNNSLPLINIDAVYNQNNQNNSQNIYGSISMNSIIGDNLQSKERIWDSLSSKTLREAIVFIKRKLIDIIAKENINVEVSTITSTSSGVMNVQPLKTLLSTLTTSSPKILLYKYRDIIQCLCAIIQTLECSQHLYWDNLLSIEKILLLTYGQEDDDEEEEDDDDNGSDDDDEEKESSILSQVIDTINNPISSTENQFYTPMDLFNLCVFVFSLVGLEQVFSNNDKKKLLVALFNRLEKMDKEDEFIQILYNSNDDKDGGDSDDDENNEDDDDDDDDKSRKLKDRLKEIMGKIELIQKSRTKQREFKDLIKRGGMTGSGYQSLLSQICKSIFSQQQSASSPSSDEQQYQPQDLVKYSMEKSKLGTLLKLGGWRSTKNSRVSDNRKIIIYVQGGMTLQELKEAQDIVNSYTSKKPYQGYQVLFGTSTISNNQNLLMNYLK